MALTVKFSDIEEFLDELKKELGHIENKIVRYTNVFISHRQMPDWHHIHAIGTCIINSGHGDRLLRYEEYIGAAEDLDENLEIRTRINTRRTLMKKAAEENGLDLRNGMIEDKWIGSAKSTSNTGDES